MKPLLAIPISLFAFMSVSQAQDSDTKAIEHFDKYLTDCPKHEIRCVWFLNGSVRVGMIMKLNLSANDVLTVREVHDWAHQSQETRRLSHSQIGTLKKLVGEMPESAVSKTRVDLVYISYYKNDAVVVRKYLRHGLPRTVERFYDIGGGYIDTTQAEQGEDQ